MRRYLVLAGVALLGGCQSVEQLRALAPQQSDYTICSSMVAGNPNLRQVAAEEQQRRRLDCTPHLGMIAAQQQSNALQTATGLQLLQMAQPQPVMPAPMPPMSVICTSRPGPGGTSSTVCQ
jgi:hypothetical protein